MKTTIIAILGAILLVSAIPGIHAQTLHKMDGTTFCYWKDPGCKRLAEILNKRILANPEKEMPNIWFVGAKWTEVYPETTLRIYSLYHFGFYYGQKIPIDQQVYYCYDCDVETALKAEDAYGIKLIMAKS